MRCARYARCSTSSHADSGVSFAPSAERRQLRQTIRRYDLNGDGNVDPSEMPPAAAQRMRPMDRNGDGWVDENDFH
jgi:EF hand